MSEDFTRSQLSSHFTLVFSHSQTNCVFRKKTEFFLSGIRLFLRGHPKALVDSKRGMKRVLQYLSPTLTPGYQCHLFLVIKKLDIITGCQRIMQSSIYKFPSKTSVFEKRKVMLRLIFFVYKRGPIKTTSRNNYY